VASEVLFLSVQGNASSTNSAPNTNTVPEGFIPLPDSDDDELPF
jgi:hypothetical protein